MVQCAGRADTRNVVHLIECRRVFKVHDVTTIISHCSLICCWDTRLLVLPLFVAVTRLIYLQTELTRLLLPTIRVLAWHEALAIILVNYHGLLDLFLSHGSVSRWHRLINRIRWSLFKSYSKIVIRIHIPCSTIDDTNLRDSRGISRSGFSARVLRSRVGLLEGHWRLHILNGILLLIEFLLIFLIAALSSTWIHTSSSTRQEGRFTQVWSIQSIWRGWCV